MLEGHVGISRVGSSPVLGKDMHVFNLPVIVSIK